MVDDNKTKDKSWVIGTVAIVSIVAIFFGFMGFSNLKFIGFGQSTEDKDLVGEAIQGASRPSTGCKSGCVSQALNAEVAKSLSTATLNPTRCPLTVFQKSVNPGTIVVNCAEREANKVVGMVTHIDCPSMSDTRAIVGTSWEYDNLPFYLEYTCIDREGNWRAPSQIFAHCCDITQGVSPRISTGERAEPLKKTTTVDKSGKIQQK